MDSAGRLNYFAVIGPQESASPMNEAPPDWQPLFAAAALDLQHSHTTDARWLPDVPSDKSFAWEASAPGKTLQVQGASYHNKIVFFRVVAPWSRSERDRPTQPSLASRFGIGLFVVTLFISLTICIMFARRNLKQGRVDSRGAIWVAIAVFAVVLLGQALSAHFVGDADWILVWFFLSSGLALTNVAQFFLLYVALEPYVRRTWPEILISWSRLVAGGWKNPLVGRDVLIGVLFGIAMVSPIYLRTALPDWFPVTGITPGPPGSQDWREGSVFLGNVVTNILGIMDAVGSLAMVFLVTKITRSKTAGMLVVVLLVVGFNLYGENLPIEVAVATLVAVLWLICLMRVGLLSICVARCVAYAVGTGLATFDLSRWYAWRGLTQIAVVLALALYGFKVALGKNPLFGAAFED